MGIELVENTKTNEEIAKLMVGGLISSSNSIFGRHLPIYRQSTEPVAAYLKREDIEDKDVLTVASSGDFLIHILTNNPKSVSTFDPNIFAKYYQDLKIAGIIALDYREFLDFFCGKEALNIKSFIKIIPILPDNVRHFWEALLSVYSPEVLIKSSLFTQRYVSKEKAVEANSYLRNEANYLRAKEVLLKSSYSFHNLNLLNLGRIKKKFDTIFLSSVLGSIEPERLRSALESMISCARTSCNNNGVVIASTVNNGGLEAWKSNDYEMRLVDKYASIKVKK